MSWTLISGILLSIIFVSLAVHAGTTWYVINLLKQVKYYDVYSKVESAEEIVNDNITKA